jgi:hypothetical protein
MNMNLRRTLVVSDRTALRAHRLQAARSRRNGLQVLTFEQLAVRLAGGFVRPIDSESLRVALKAVLPVTPLGELEAIKCLPGMVDAAARTLGKVWRSGIDLQARAGTHARIAALVRLEQAVLAQLPAGMYPPAAIAAAAQARLAHAPAVLGPVDLDGLSGLAPCWRALLVALATQVPLRWIAGPRAVPAWLEQGGIDIVRGDRQTPAFSIISAATPAHEALEAMRWVRQLLASQQALPHEIALTSADPARFDAHLLALREEAGIDLHFVHGVPVTSARPGQAAAALADTLVHGVTQRSLRRLARLCADTPLLRALPEGWLKVLPAGAALATPQAWQRLLARIAPVNWPGGADHVPALAALTALVGLLQQGVDAAEQAGEQLLDGRALGIWRQALATGAAVSLPATIDAMKQDDGLDVCASVAWMPASVLAATPRRFVRLIGLNAGLWPRGSTEDGLLPDHVVAADELEWETRAQADSRDFDDLLGVCASIAVLSFSRRNDEGRGLGKSPLLAQYGRAVHLLRHAAPSHAMSEADRLAARLPEFSDMPQGRSAAACWHNWQGTAVGAHDGAVRPGHPMLASMADRLHSASSLKRLLRNPIGYLWEYGLGWRAAEQAEEPLMLDPAAFGNLVHEILDLAVQDLEYDVGVRAASRAQIGAALDVAIAVVSAAWAKAAELPPAAIWRHSLAQARQLGFAALTMDVVVLDAARAYGEVPFGGAPPKSAATPPWDAARPVTINIDGATLRISGYIDRLDISSDRSEVLVRDYKTGKPVAASVVLGGGAELQRCLYAYAAREMLGAGVAVRSTLMYPRDGIELELDDPDAAIRQLAGYLGSAYRSLLSGNCLPGPDTGGAYDKFAFLLPANASGSYCKRKNAAVAIALGEAATVWETT